MTKPDQLTEVEVDRLTLHPKNVRRGDVDMIAQSLQRFGQVSPIIVQRSTGYVVAGNHTLKAIRKLGWPTAKIVVKDLSDADALAYLVADNRASDRATYDDSALRALLDEVDLEGTGFSVDDLETLDDRLGENVSSADDIGDPSYRPPDDRVIRRAERSDEDKSQRVLRDIVLMMTVSDAEDFGQQITVLQTRWDTRTVVDTVRRAVRVCVEDL